MKSSISTQLLNDAMFNNYSKQYHASASSTQTALRAAHNIITKLLSKNLDDNNSFYRIPSNCSAVITISILRYLQK